MDNKTVFYFRHIAVNTVILFGRLSCLNCVSSAIKLVGIINAFKIPSIVPFALAEIKNRLRRLHYQNVISDGSIHAISKFAAVKISVLVKCARNDNAHNVSIT